ncbi:MAG: DUF1304 domain-containing protein [Patescibacteria group bacterium]
MIVIEILIAGIALFHVFAFVMESVLWETPRARRIFNTTPETARATRVLALNQGVYNLFLAAGLVWSLTATDPVGYETKIFFLSCVVIAGVVAGFTVSKRVFIVQAVPALIALALVLTSSN